MKRETAFQMAIAALKEKQGRQYVFDYNMFLLFQKAGQNTDNLKHAYKHYLRIDQAIEILENERDHQQLSLIP